MNIIVREYRGGDVADMVEIWNEVVEDGVAFPQEEYLTDETGREFFAAQTYTAVAEDADTGRVLGLYILHPNNVGRCGHICNASYAVERTARTSHRRKAGKGLPRRGRAPRLWDIAVQRRRCLKHTCKASL